MFYRKSFDVAIKEDARAKILKDIDIHIDFNVEINGTV